MEIPIKARLSLALEASRRKYIKAVLTHVFFKLPRCLQIAALYFRIWTDKKYE